MNATLNDIANAIELIPKLVSKIEALEYKLQEFKDVALYKDILSIEDVANYLNISTRVAKEIMLNAGASKIKNGQYFIERVELKTYLKRYKNVSEMDIDKAVEDYIFYGKKASPLKKVSSKRKKIA